MTTITHQEAAILIDNTNGRTFTCHFIKKGNNKLRIMNCRTGVKKHLKGGTLPYNPKDHALKGVYDMQNGGYKMISLNRITKLIVDKKEYEVR